MTFQETIKSIFSASNIKFAVAVLVVFLGINHPEYQALANTIAVFLGYNIVVTTTSDAVAQGIARASKVS
jgi:hypothetical protein